MRPACAIQQRRPGLESQFYWNSNAAGWRGAPSGALADRVKDSFGDYTKFRQEFFIARPPSSAALAWLTQSADKKLQVVKTANADTQWHGHKHACYL